MLNVVELSARSDVPPFYVMEVMREAERLESLGREILHLEVGQPSTAAPDGALQVVQSLLGTDRMGYTGAAGLPALRSRIADWYRTRYNTAVDTDQIVVTTGASGSFVLTFLALFDAGQRVAVLEPGYPCYRNDLDALGVTAVSVPLRPEHNYRPSLDDLDGYLPLDGLIVASPSNPTGTIIPESQMRALIDWCQANKVALIVDEIYHGITFGDPPPSALGLIDDPGESPNPPVVVINSFSKFFSMTGWRVGWVATQPTVAARIERLAQSLTIAPPTVSQHCALASFDCLDELESNVDRYRDNRDVILRGLASAGLTKTAPADGAFYVWCDVSQFGLDSQLLAARWLEEIGVASTPGVDFDQRRGSDFIRFSYAGDAADLDQACQAIAEWMTTVD